ncbi:unnamed protein product [Callosobruchus maculatus]|uniref:Uncharacterized protein n=1 Tax=Callosobruchus maculatus TaxID=64391 RepID=A0A653BHH0_CALMS|nr:unnamed protein product [Callosobruchus maculatus]
MDNSGGSGLIEALTTSKEVDSLKEARAILGGEEDLVEAVFSKLEAVPIKRTHEVIRKASKTGPGHRSFQRYTLLVRLRVFFYLV